MSTIFRRTLLTASILIFCAPSAQAQQDIFPFLAQAKESSVNVRAGQNRNFERLCQLEQGEEVIVIDKAYSWYKIRLPLKADVYISERYLIKRRAKLGEVSAERVNVRAGPGINYSVIGQVSLAQEVVIKDHKDGWYKIEPVADSFGWVQENLLGFKSASIPDEAVAVQTEPQNEFTDSSEVDKIWKEAGHAGGQDADKPFEIVEGILQEQFSADRGRYYTIKGSSQSYFVVGLHPALDDFRGFKVRAQGRVKRHLVSDESPLITVSQIQLIL